MLPKSNPPSTVTWTIALTWWAACIRACSPTTNFLQQNWKHQSNYAQLKMHPNSVASSCNEVHSLARPCLAVHSTSCHCSLFSWPPCCTCCSFCLEWLPHVPPLLALLSCGPQIKYRFLRATFSNTLSKIRFHLLISVIIGICFYTAFATICHHWFTIDCLLSCFCMESCMSVLFTIPSPPSTSNRAQNVVFSVNICCMNE